MVVDVLLLGAAALDDGAWPMTAVGIRLPIQKRLNNKTDFFIAV